MAKKLAWLFGVVFVIVGILGFIPNPIVGEGALFHTNAVHNLAHILLGVFLFIGASQSEDLASKFLIISGVVYLVLAIWGFAIVPGDGISMILNIIAINAADNWLHIVLAIALIAAGLMARKAHPVATTAAR